ncbi:hypothetical protein Calab_0444 [Caldithrix abyssi DSM 13497]|uniref:DUF3996 domain-containing protein n=1 Tax=Caldithrix abyssi DSM 13497 TaxID=880073 RepID=H1XQZ5_CALAY|nr:hypothetical protein [Caldithrix abyssi]APF20007.1 hypothetical protein Cabys_3259 [Caldithrix abyssi DSM 13497]EHO40089.1 hypothetical protein Calab_0444 [Caldithrix abyssi DSM 13497]
MRRFISAIILSAFLLGTLAAQTTGKGVGVIIGEPTGISLKVWQTATTAIDGGLAWSFGSNSKLHFHADYLIHNKNVLKEPNYIFYYGPGVRLRMGDDDRLGVRGVLGVNYFFQSAPLDMFLEIVPILDLLPGTYLSFNAGVGLRYFF